MGARRVIQSRQQDDALWSSVGLLEASATEELPIRNVDGYGAVKLFGFSDQEFRVRVEQGPTAEGPWVETNRFTSTVNSAGDKQLLTAAILPAGLFMRLFRDNLAASPMLESSFTGTGQPIAGGSFDGSGGGGGGGCCPPGDEIQSEADVAVGVGATVPLAAPPAGTRSMTIEVTDGDATTLIRVREVGGTAGAGRQLVLRGSTAYVSAIAPLEVEHEAGPTAAVSISFEV